MSIHTTREHRRQLARDNLKWPAALVRLSINITSMDGARWKDGISWEDMQRIKAEAGYPMHDAVEVFPRAVDVVNVANMRHIWIMRDLLSFAWRNS